MTYATDCRDAIYRDLRNMASADNPVMAKVLADLDNRDDAFFASVADMDRVQLAIKLAKGEI